MIKIDLNRVERRYTIRDIQPLHTVLKKLGFKVKNFSHMPITFTLFCDTPDFALPDNERIKIRTYTDKVPKKVDTKAVYKLNFKTHKENATSRKISLQGGFDELINEAQNRAGLPVTPQTAMSYYRSHYMIDGDESIRVTIDEGIVFYRVNGDSLEPFYQYDTTFLELKYDPIESDALITAEKILSSIIYEESVSKKITMYHEYQRVFG